MKHTLSEIKGTKAVTGAVPFSKDNLLYLLASHFLLKGTKMDPLDTNIPSQRQLMYLYFWECIIQQYF